MNVSSAKVQNAVSLLGEILEYIEEVEIDKLSDDDLFDLMSEAKTITNSLTALYKVGREHILPKVKLNGNRLVTKNGEFSVTLGYARMSAPKFEKALIAEGLSLDKIKKLKEESKGSRPEQLELNKSGQ